MSEGYQDTEDSLEDLMYIISEISKNLTRDELINILKKGFPDKYLFKEENIYISDLSFEFDEQGKFIRVRQELSKSDEFR